MSHRKSRGGRSPENIESGDCRVGGDHEDDMETGKGASRQLLYVTLALLAVVGGAAYVERNVLLGSMPSIREIRKLDELVVGSGVPPPLPQTRELSPPPLPPPSFTQAKEGKLSLVPAPPSLTVDLESVNLQPPRQIALAAAVAAAAIPPDDEAAVVDEVANLQAKVTAKTAVVRAMKFERHMIMETDLDALAATHELQEMCKKLVLNLCRRDYLRCRTLTSISDQHA
mmetsp:Transcript_74752/g.150390  ORF Transcript_74752/g.150390 Transcript_74752/m.150390 type:complete len:228 (+) Transcript_74752:62-745(+)